MYLTNDITFMKEAKIHALIRCLVVIRPGYTKELFYILNTLNNNSRKACITAFCHSSSLKFAFITIEVKPSC